MIGQFVGGINIYEGSYMRISDIAFTSIQNPPAGSANIILRVPRILTIASTQGEPAVGSLWPHIRFTGGGTAVPVTLIGNWLDGGVQVAPTSVTQKIISVGNTYNGNITITGENVMYTLTGDHFTAGYSIVDNGTNNFITEIDTYYDGIGSVVYRRMFNNIVTDYRGHASVDIRSALTTLAADNTTPSVANVSLAQTANTVPTTITNFANGVEGQRLFVQALDSLTTIDFSSSNIRGNLGVDNTMAIGDWLDCTKIGGYWYCTWGRW
jgi:hypothetical protein